MKETTARQIESMKQQTIGVEEHEAADHRG